MNTSQALNSNGRVNFNPDASGLPRQDLLTGIDLAGRLALLRMGQRDRRRLLIEVLGDQADCDAANHLLKTEREALTTWPAHQSDQW